MPPRLMSADGHGALIVLERETGLEEVAETGVMVHGDLSADLIRTIFAPRTPLHDGAVIIRDEMILAAGALLPLAEMTVHTERFGTRHRAALGITEQTDAVVVVVSEENGQVSLVERARIVRNLNEPQLARAIRSLLAPSDGARPVQPAAPRAGASTGGRAPRLAELSPARRPEAGSRATPIRPDDDGPPAQRPHGSAVRRVVRLFVHNWPLKLAAIVLATMLYAGLVVSQSIQEYTGGVQIDDVNQPDERHPRRQPAARSPGSATSRSATRAPAPPPTASRRRSTSRASIPTAPADRWSASRVQSRRSAAFTVARLRAARHQRPARSAHHDERRPGQGRPRARRPRASTSARPW